MEAIVFIVLQIFFITGTVLKIGEFSRIFPSFGWRIFSHVTRLDQSCASENIWWIINNNIWIIDQAWGQDGWIYIGQVFLHVYRLRQRVVNRVLQSGQDSTVLAAWVANHHAGLGLSCPFMELAIQYHVVKTNALRWMLFKMVLSLFERWVK